VGLGAMMSSILKTKVFSVSSVGAVIALLALGACSDDGQQKAPAPASTQAAGEQGKPQPASTQGVASGQGQNTFPDINSVPNEAPKPSTVANLSTVQAGLGSDQQNADYTDQPAVPGETVARPQPPAAAPQQGAATAKPVPAKPVPATVATATAAPTLAQKAPAAASAAPGAITAPEQPATPMDMAGGSADGYIGTPPPGAKPFDPSAQTGAIQVAPFSGVNMNTASSGNDYPRGYSQSNPSQRVYRSPYGAGNIAGWAGGGGLVGVIYFNNGSTGLSQDDRKLLGQVASIQRRSGAMVRIVGHASMGDRPGNAANYNISMARANAIVQALMELGVPPASLQAAAVGDQQPRYAESMPAGEAGNRRAEIFLAYR